MQYAQVRMINVSESSKVTKFSKKLFTFACNIKELIDGDLVMCETVYGYMVCQFSNYTDKCYGDGSTTRDVVCKIDTSEYFRKKRVVDIFMKGV